VLKIVTAVPTCLVQLDHATRVNGFPIERFVLMSGPSNEGKTKAALALIGSFLKRGHMAMLVDAERTTPITWVRELIGAEADSDKFLAMRPSSYEETVEAVRKFATALKQEREAGRVHADTSALVVVDSIRKLVPKNIMAKIMKDTEKNGVDGMGGRSAQIKAAMNAAWMDELIPLLEETRTSMLVIARETDDPDADMWDKRAGRDYKIGGGKALYYDSSMVLRVERAGYITEKFGDGESQTSKVYGERHRITITKTKIAGREERQSICYFHTSNGMLYAEGFDPGRDLLELGERLGVVSKNGSWYAFDGQKIGNGAHAAAKAVAEDSEMLASLDKAVRSAFMMQAPIEISEDGEVVA
jgi:recombination protein RecA